MHTRRSVLDSLKLQCNTNLWVSISCIPTWPSDETTCFSELGASYTWRACSSFLNLPHLPLYHPFYFSPSNQRGSELQTGSQSINRIGLNIMTHIKRRNRSRKLIKTWISSSLVTNRIRKHIPPIRVRKPASSIRVRISESPLPITIHPSIFIIIIVMIDETSQFLFIEKFIKIGCCRWYLGSGWCGGG